MYRRILWTGLLVASFATSALADREFYIAQGATGKKCVVTPNKPDGKSLIAVGAVAYKTKADAEKVLSTAPECKIVKK